MCEKLRFKLLLRYVPASPGWKTCQLPKTAKYKSHCTERRLYQQNYQEDSSTRYPDTDPFPVTVSESWRYFKSKVCSVLHGYELLFLCQISGFASCPQYMLIQINIALYSKYNFLNTNIDTYSKPEEAIKYHYKRKSLIVS